MYISINYMSDILFVIFMSICVYLIYEKNVNVVDKLLIKYLDKILIY